ncbi:hypothetical protein NDU88_008892 [Pleurodeles waltl]|uniref:Uncharacterized protein n=1 Tax=Pleurodeles waltl TaxID=8319 RepID=A0AAV7RZG7_PLEWA|nr:hypothetical protein NDU88_008892 [Pleurodeles waltl]
MSERQTPEESVLLNDQEDLLLAEDIVHALDASVAQSVNWALAVALQPIARQLKRYALTVPPFGNPMSLASTNPETVPPMPGPGWPHSARMACLSQSQSPSDHQYTVQRSTSAQALLYPSPDEVSDVSSSQSDSDSEARPHKRSRCSFDGQRGPTPSEASYPSSVLNFNTDDIIHPSFRSEVPMMRFRKNPLLLPLLPILLERNNRSWLGFKAKFAKTVLLLLETFKFFSLQRKRKKYGG